ncbi:hypothetical protein KP509_08G073100 [Ceratopteris richardii]|uniref:Uncharacterized protein n=1 Tax=Ceratopteris richardii TaxID=49495 RepID=A0A8T2U7X3_CERRI|nr:hypothetical protein KP509_08G073100 [Ceratopteris richardii]
MPGSLCLCFALDSCANAEFKLGTSCRRGVLSYPALDLDIKSKSIEEHHDKREDFNKLKIH